MTSYRVYCFDGSGRITTAQLVEARDDEEALALARAANIGVRHEVWERSRLVGSPDVIGGEAPEPA